MPVTIAQGQETHLEVILEPEAADESSDNLRLETEELVKRILEPLRAKAARVAQASPTEVYLNQGYGQMKVGERYEIVGLENRYMIPILGSNWASGAASGRD